MFSSTHNAGCIVVTANFFICLLLWKLKKALQIWSILCKITNIISMCWVHDQLLYLSTLRQCELSIQSPGARQATHWSHIVPPIGSMGRWSPKCFKRTTLYVCFSLSALNFHGSKENRAAAFLGSLLFNNTDKTVKYISLLWTVWFFNGLLIAGSSARFQGEHIVSLFSRQCCAMPVL